MTSFEDRLLLAAEMLRLVQERSEFELATLDDAYAVAAHWTTDAEDPLGDNYVIPPDSDFKHLLWALAVLFDMADPLEEET